MHLYINTTQGDKVFLMILKQNTIISKKQFKARYSQAEKLLPEIDRLFKKQKIKLSDIKKIIVNNKGGGFSALRIGIITANALGYALGIPVVSEKEVKGKEDRRNYGQYSIVKPKYSKEPNITMKK